MNTITYPTGRTPEVLSKYDSGAYVELCYQEAA